MNTSSDSETTQGGGWIYSAVPFLVAFIILIVWAEGGYAKHEAQKQATEARQQAQAMAAQQVAQYAMAHPQPISQCDVPCHMPLKRGQQIGWSVGHPLEVRYNGSTKWIPLQDVNGGINTALRDDKENAKKFKEGEADFRSSDSPVTAYVYP